MLAGGLNVIKIISSGENAVIPRFAEAASEFEAAPRLNHGVFREAGREDLVPSDHALAVFFQNGHTAVG